MRSATLAVAILLVLRAPVAAGEPDTQTDRDLTSLSIEELMNVKVRTASLHQQSISDAPAGVTVVTQQDIRKYGYRTLAEVLQGIAGFFDSYDRSFHNPGVRGFSVPGHYGTRMLVLIDGNNLAAPGNGATPFGMDFPLDLSLVKQIEIVKGPTSALYGSGGTLATINVITQSAEEAGRAAVRVELDSLGEKKVQISSPVALGKDARLLLSGSLFNTAGEQSMYLPDLDAPEFNFGRALRMDGERGYHVYAALTWKNWRALMIAGERLKIQPVSWAPTVFNDRGTRAGVGMVISDLTYTQEWSGKTLQWHTYYGAFRLHGIFHYPLDQAVADTRENDADDWSGTKLNLRVPVRRLGSVTLGVEGRFDLRTLMSSREVEPAPGQRLSINQPDQSFALFAQDEIDLSKHWRADLGIRRDDSRYRPDFVSPRAALIYHRASGTSYKLLYGRSFRNPTPYELYFDDGVTDIANTALLPEKADTFEFVTEQRIAKWLQAVVSLYHYRIDDMILAQFVAEGALQFQNAGSASASGVELEAVRRFDSGAEFGGSLAFQRTVDRLTRYPFPNSPGQVGKLRAALPLFRNRLSLAAAFQYLGKRQTLAGETMPRALLTDLVLSTNRLTWALDLQFGVRNLFNRRYFDPVALTPIVDEMPGPGRTVFLSLVWRVPESWLPLPSAKKRRQ